jgi:hypothetical protein
VLKGVGLGHASFSKLRVGSGACEAATALLEWVTTNKVRCSSNGPCCNFVLTPHFTSHKVPKVKGNCRLTYASTASGKLAAEWTVRVVFVLQ